MSRHHRKSMVSYARTTEERYRLHRQPGGRKGESMYSKESLQKVLKLMADAEKMLRDIPANDIKLCISAGNRKIGRVMNVSLPPIKSRPNCSKCKWLCYDVKACLQYPNTVIDARMRNYVILKKDRDAYFARIDAAMNRRRLNKYFRWHVAGEIVDIDYFDRMIKNAIDHPDFTI